MFKYVLATLLFFASCLEPISDQEKIEAKDGVDKDTLTTGFATNRYNSTGIVESEGKLINGLKDSLWKFYTNDGVLKEVVTFLNDTAHGEFKIYYPTGLSVKSKGSFIKGSLSGLVESYFEDGTIESSTAYKNNQKDGPHLEFDVQEQISNTPYISTSGYYKNGLKDSLWQLFEYSFDLSTQRFRNKLILTDSYHYSKDVLNGKSITYEPQYGFKLIETYYSKGIENGTRYNYCPSGPDQKKLWFTEVISNGISVSKSPYLCDCRY